jgi:hypothetical protein
MLRNSKIVSHFKHTELHGTRFEECIHHSTLYLFLVTHCGVWAPGSAPLELSMSNEATYLGPMVPSGDMPTVVTDQNPVSNK